MEKGEVEVQLYMKKPSQAGNIAEFQKIMRRFDWARWFQPNPDKAPWHVVCEIRGEGPYPVFINFWPHVAKAQREGCQSVEGWDKIRLLIAEAIDENGYGGCVELVE